MCITNKQFEDTLKAIRAYEAGEKDEAKMAEILANIKVITDCLESVEKKIKADMKDTYSGEVHYFPSIEKKVYLAEGRSSSTINPADFILSMRNAGLENVIADCVTVVKTKVEKCGHEEAIKIAEFHTVKESGTPTITVMKMNKQELIENRA